MKNMKKVLLVVGLLLVFLIGGMFVGSKIGAGANSSWTNEIVNEANKLIGQAGYAKKEELKNKDLTSAMQDALDPKIAEEQAALEKMLEEYYQMKLAGLQDTPEFKKVEEQIEALKISVYNRYKSEIDSIFTK